MGCNSSKTAAKTGEEQTSKTLLTADAASTEPTKEEPAPEASKQAEPATDEKAAEVPVLLKVTILSARGLRNADWVGKSDPYCAWEVTGKSDTKKQTPSVTDQLDPEWNHEEEVTGYCVGDSITFLVKDMDPAKPDDALGKVVLETSQFLPGGFEGEVPLTEAGSGIEAFLKLKIVVVHPKVRVIVNSAKGLRNADWVGKSDPYCICEVVGKEDVKFATPSVDDNLNPQWSHEAELVGYQVLDGLTFTVKDKDPVKPDDILGSVTLPYESFRNGFDGELQLTGTAEGITSTLQLKVEMGDKADETPKQPETENQDVSEAASPAATDAASPQQPAEEPVITADTAPPKAMSCFC